MHIVEIPVLGSQQNQMEKIYSLFTDKSLRSFEGFDLGMIELDKDLFVYFYFLNQENESYHYLWDLMIPHAIGCLLVFDWLEPQSIERNLRTIDYLEGRFSTPLHICSLPAKSEIPDDLIKEELAMNGQRQLYPFDPTSKDCAKQILLNVLRFNS